MKNELTKKELQDLLKVAGKITREKEALLDAFNVKLTRCQAVAASAFQVLNLALQEPKDSAMTAHLVHVATVALGTIED
jgi:hypothetical protein